MSDAKYVATVSASPDLIWETLTDPVKMKSWARARKVTIERPGTEAQMGTGAVRAITTLFGTYREEVTSFDPPRRITYRVISGLPVRDYEGRMELEPTTSGTQITWSVTYTPTTVLAPIVPFATKRVQNAIFRRLIRQLQELG